MIECNFSICTPRDTIKFCVRRDKKTRITMWWYGAFFAFHILQLDWQMDQTSPQ